MRLQRSFPALGAALAAIAAAPSITASPELDERFGVYAFTAEFGRNPIAIVHHAIETVPDFVRQGNFRPGGRIIEWSGHNLAGHISLLLNLPINVSLGILRLVAAAVLAASVVSLVARVLTRPGQSANETLMLAVTCFVGASFLVSAIESPVNLFPWLYLGSGAVAVLAARSFTRPELYGTAAMSRRSMVWFGVLGALLAATNEITTLALPLAAAVIVSRCIVLEHTLDRTLLRLAAVRAYVITAATFLAVFVPVRLTIASACGDGSCYAASDVSVSDRYPETVVGRVATGFLPPQWRVGSNDPALDAIRDGELLIVAAAFAVFVGIALFTLRHRIPRSGDDFAPPIRTRDAVAVCLIGLMLLVSTSALLSTSRLLQDSPRRVGQAWRDTALTTPGAALITAALIALVAQAVATRTPIRAWVWTAVAGGGAMFISFVTTWGVGVEAELDQERMLNNRIALEAVVFSDDAESNAHRCSLQDAWTVHHREGDEVPYRPGQVFDALDAFVLYAHGAVAFCDDMP